MSTTKTSTTQSLPAAKLKNTNKRVYNQSVADAQLIQGPQSQRLIIGAANELGGCEHISAGLVWMPPSKVAKPHLHKDNELILFIIEGWVASLLGPDLDEIVYHGPGDFFYIPAGVVHMGVNLSDKHRMVAVETRTDPYFNDDVVIFPELEEKAAGIAADLRAKFAAGEIVPEAKKRGFGPFKFQEVEVL